MKRNLSAHLILLFILIVQNILSFVIAFGNVNLPTLPLMVLSQLSILLPFIVYCFIKKQNPLKIIRFKKISIKTALMCVIIALCSYPVMIYLNLLSMFFVENAMSDVMTDVLTKGALIGMLFMAVMPAIVEETVFRGVVYNTYSKRRPLFGVFFSALIFGLMHMNFNQLPYAFFLGIVLALVMEASDSIIAPMIVHFTVNGSSTLISFLTAGVTDGMEISQNGDFKSMLLESYQISLSESGTTLSEAAINTMYPIFMAIIVIVAIGIIVVASTIVFALIYGLSSMNKRKLSVVFKADHSDTAYIVNRKGKMKKNRMIDVPVILFMIYSLLMCILTAA